MRHPRTGIHHRGTEARRTPGLKALGPEAFSPLQSGSGCQLEEVAPGDCSVPAFHALGGSSEDVGLPAGFRGLLATRDGMAVGRLAWIVAHDVRGVAGPCGLVGWYRALDEGAGVALLREARRRLASLGVARILGPMDGSTWGSYRLALPSAGESPEVPPFLTEPRHPPEYTAYFAAAGFRISERYESRIVRNLAARPGAAALAERLEHSGIQVRCLDRNRLEEELQLLFEFSTLAFRGNVYYRPIPYEQFRQDAHRLLPVLDPELIRLAYDRNEQLLGFVLAFPDPLHTEAGRPNRVVLKTIASRPGTRCRGLSAYLADQVHALAQQKGYSAVIHALMHSDNDSLRISQRYDSEVIRRYALYKAE